ncbi:hypothetical protein B0H11DRAFT_1926880 [Mycena galericulata]|nr:hypothetical protein B0H11DRAFT_1926880 [Mycena galericulata]
MDPLELIQSLSRSRCDPQRYVSKISATSSGNIGQPARRSQILHKIGAMTTNFSPIETHARHFAKPPENDAWSANLLLLRNLSVIRGRRACFRIAKPARYSSETARGPAEVNLISGYISLLKEHVEAHHMFLRRLLGLTPHSMLAVRLTETGNFQNAWTMFTAIGRLMTVAYKGHIWRTPSYVWTVRFIEFSSIVPGGLQFRGFN